ncbi:hybrid sensor histidine kinase/response regulator transcription factor [Carboxylicivirga taeanensis]|uniref:hybrid sensor histidine kinase/response regulator transcription factor n=1 Tax=Carboxylicivirga taeanensis TaxID=1416875 RepID=UPI003F6E0267
MRRFEKRVLYLCLLVLLQMKPLPGNATQDVIYSLQHISLEKGLSQSKILALNRDKVGRLWLGTRNGLNRYDGVTMHTYFRHSERPSGLLDDFIYFIVEDGERNIWVGTGKGLAKYDFEHDLFRQLPSESGSRSVVYSNALACGDSVIFGTTDHLAIYNSTDNQIKQLYFKGDTQSLPLLYKIVEWNNNQVLIASRWNGLFRCDLNTGQLTKLQWIGENNLLTVLKDDEDQLWVSVYKKGLYKISADGELLQQYHSSNSALRSDIVLALCEIDNEIWIGTDGGGLQRLNLKENQIYTVQIASDYNPALNSISEIFLDEYSNMWLGTVNGGAFNLKEVCATSFSDVPWGNTNGLSSQTVLSLFAESDNTVWVGTDGGGINKYRLNTGTFEHFASTRNKKINAIIQLSDDELLINCFAEGLKIFNTRSGTLSDFHLTPQGDAYIPGQGYMGVSLFKTSDRQILVIDSQLQLIDVPERTIELIFSPKIHQGEGGLKLAGRQQSDVYLYGQNGIYCYHSLNKSIEQIHRVNAGETIKCAFVDKERSLWVSTSKSFYYISGQQQSKHEINLGGLGTVTSIAEGSEKQLWIGAGRNIVMLDKESGSLHRMGVSDGFMPNEYYDKPNVAIGRHILKGGANGLVHIREDQYFHRQDSVQLMVTNIRKNGKAGDESILRNYQQDKSVQLPYNFGMLEFNLMVKSADLFRDKTIKYAIEGFSEQFIETNDQRISIIGLKPGNYKVKAKVVDADGIWTPAATVMNISVLPPWWQTIWFKLLIVVAAITVVLVIWAVLYNRHMVKVQMEIQEKDKLLNEQKLAFMTNISHEIRTPLTLIYAPLEQLIKEDEHQARDKELLQLVYKQVKYLKGLVEQALNLERVENPEEVLQLAPVPFNEWLKEVIDGFDFELKNSGMQVDFQLDPQIKELSLDKQAITKVVYNLIINVIRHAPETKTLGVSTQLTDQATVKVTFSDEGPGIPAEQLSELFKRFFQATGSGNGYGIGLAYAKALVERHGGKIGAANNETEGARFFFELPSKSAWDENDCPVEPMDEQILKNLKSDEKGSGNEEQMALLGQLTLLVVEDNEDLSQYIKRLLRSLFKRVIVARNGEEGFNKALTEMPDIILSDVMMPLMDGNELCRRVKSTIEISHIPVVLLTARHDEVSVEKGYKMGADRYLTKPFSNDLLVDVIYNLLLSRQKIQESYQSALLQESAVAHLTVSNADEQFLKQVNEIITQELSNPDLGVDMLVDRMAISRATLYNKFKSILGLGINTYINDYRIAEAKELLVHSDELLGGIAEKIGFKSQSYFSTFFKQQTGETPMQYRQNSKLASEVNANQSSEN